MDLEALKAAFDEARVRFNIPSYSAAIFYDGGFTTLSAGLRDAEQAAPADGDTLYAIGSCTKSFVAGAICTLADKGLLGLDDCVRDYIPEFEMYDGYVSTHLTVRDMLCHRCGLARHELAWYPRLDTLTQAQIVRSLRYLRPSQPFRYKWQYSNQMYVLAGMLVERVTGETWQDTVRRNIFEPLGITRAAFTPHGAEALGGRAVPYLPGRETGTHRAVAHAELGAMSSAGCLYMTARELAKWAAALLGGGAFGGTRVISEKLCREMMSPQMIQSDGILEPMKEAVTNSGYGLGLMTEVFRGRRFIHHGGHVDGFMADLSFLPDDGFACTVLTNLGQVRGAQVMRYIAAEHFLDGGGDWSKLLYGFFGEERRRQREASGRTLAEKPGNAPCPVPLEAICGTYFDPGYGEIEIGAGDGALKIRIGTLTVTGTHYANQFFYLEAPEIAPGQLIEANVVIDAKGAVTGFDAAFDDESTQKIHFIRKNNIQKRD